MNRPGISWCLMNEVRPMTNSRKLFIGETRSSAERLSTATRSGWNVLDLLLHADQVVLERGRLRVRRRRPEPPVALHPREVDAPARARCGRAARGSPRRRTAGSARPSARPAARNSVAISVLPVPVGPETRMIESRKKPPPHIASSSATARGDAQRRTTSASARSPRAGSRRSPRPATIVNGHSPFWWSVPRNLRISTVRRRLLLLERRCAG